MSRPYTLTPSRRFEPRPLSPDEQANETNMLKLARRLAGCTPEDIEHEGRENFCEYLARGIGQLDKMQSTGRLRMIAELRLKHSSITQGALL